MNYTKNYHLPQWEEDDRVLRSDFNNAMAALEDGLQANAQGVREAKTEAVCGGDICWNCGSTGHLFGISACNGHHRFDGEQQCAGQHLGKDDGANSG